MSRSLTGNINPVSRIPDLGHISPISASLQISRGKLIPLLLANHLTCREPSFPPHSISRRQSHLVPLNRIFDSCLALYLQVWEIVTSNSCVLSIIANGYSLEFLAPPSNHFVVTPPSPQLSGRSPVSSGKTAIETVPQHLRGTGFYSRYFLVPKRDRDLRSILDLRGLNHSLKDRKFCMTTLQSIFQFITINLQDAYFHISVRPYYCRFLRFAVGDLHFQYVALPFGLSASSRVFTKCIVVIATYFRLQGAHIFQYLDDWLLLADSKPLLHAHLQPTLSLLKELGVVVNFKKSAITPVRCLQYIGDILDSMVSMAFLLSDRALTLRSLVLQVISAPPVYHVADTVLVGSHGSIHCGSTLRKAPHVPSSTLVPMLLLTGGGRSIKMPLAATSCSGLSPPVDQYTNSDLGYAIPATSFANDSHNRCFTMGLGSASP